MTARDYECWQGLHSNSLNLGKFGGYPNDFEPKSLYQNSFKEYAPVLNCVHKHKTRCDF